MLGWLRSRGVGDMGLKSVNAAGRAMDNGSWGITNTTYSRWNRQDEIRGATSDRVQDRVGEMRSTATKGTQHLTLCEVHVSNVCGKVSAILLRDAFLTRACNASAGAVEYPRCWRPPECVRCADSVPHRARGRALRRALRREARTFMPSTTDSWSLSSAETQMSYWPAPSSLRRSSLLVWTWSATRWLQE